MKKGLIVLLFVSVLLTTLIFLPYSANIIHGLPNAIDPVFYAWNLSHNASTAFKSLDLQLNTNIFYPLTNTLAYSDTLWGQSIITNPVIWITHNPVLAENIGVLISFPLAALAMYMLSFYLTQNPTASFVSGLFFAFSFPRLAQIGHLPTITSQWLPLYILSLLKFLEDGKRKNLLFVLLWYILSISSSIYFGVFLIPITAVIIFTDFIKRVSHRKTKEYKKLLITCIPFIIPFMIILALLLFPYIRLKAENPDLKRSIDDLTHLRASFTDYVSVLPTSINTAKFLPNNTNEHVLYPTLALTALALLGLLTSRKRNRYAAGTFALIAFVSCILSLGNEQSFALGPFRTGIVKMPYYYLYTFFPLFQIVRVPARFGIFIILSFSALASMGIVAISKLKTSKWIIGILLCMFIAEIWQYNTPVISLPSEKNLPKVYQWIREQPEPMILAELPISLFYHGETMENQLYRTYDALRQSDTYAIETYRIYFSTFHHKRMINGYSGFLTDSYNRLAENLENFPSEYSIRSLQDIGVTHAVVHLWQYDNKRRSDITKALSDSPLLTVSYSQNGDLVYAINKKTK
jgi:hypothetical protein